MIYPPAEDSYLMSEILKREIPFLLDENPNLKVLEMGAGSGINLGTLFKLGVKKENIFSIDINPKAVAHCSSLGFHCLQSDLFEFFHNMRFPSEAQKEIAQPQREGRLREGNHGCPRFDIIIFNPPYLPEDAREPCDSRTATTGGKSGCEIINRFLQQAKNHLTHNGKIFLITSSLTKEINWKNWKKKELGCEKLFFEELCVWELIKS